MTATAPVPNPPSRAPAPRAPARHEKRKRVSHTFAFWSVAAAFTVLMAFGTVPTPLWPLYQGRDHFGATTVTVAFAVMVVGAAVSFLALGHLSDRLGRRRVIAPALLVATLAAVLLAVWPALPGLIVGRFLTGVGVGLMAPTATAYLADLHHRARRTRTPLPAPALVAAAANLGGLAVGPLVSGVLAEWGPAPLATTYIVFAVVMVLLLALVPAGPETVDTGRGAQDRPTRFALRPGRRTAFGAAATMGFLAFAVMGLFSSLGAIIVRGQLGITSQFVLGLVLFATFAASATAQLALDRLSPRRLLWTGALLLPAGLGLTALSLYQPTLGIFLPGAVLAGAGAGLLFKGAVTQSALASDPASRAGVLAIFFVAAYLGMGLPSVAFSVIIQHADLALTMIGFAVLLTLGTVGAVVTADRSRRAGGP